MAVVVAVVGVVVVVGVIIGWRSDGCYQMVSRCRRSPIYE